MNKIFCWTHKRWIWFAERVPPRNEWGKRSQTTEFFLLIHFPKWKLCCGIYVLMWFLSFELWCFDFEMMRTDVCYARKEPKNWRRTGKSVYFGSKHHSNFVFIILHSRSHSTRIEIIAMDLNWMCLLKYTLYDLHVCYTIWFEYMSRKHVSVWIVLSSLLFRGLRRIRILLSLFAVIRCLYFCHSFSSFLHLSM